MSAKAQKRRVGSVGCVGGQNAKGYDRKCRLTQANTRIASVILKKTAELEQKYTVLKFIICLESRIRLNRSTVFSIGLLFLQKNLCMKKTSSTNIYARESVFLRKINKCINEKLNVKAKTA